MINTNEQKPATKNQISNEKPQVINSTKNVMQGWIANSINGGMIKPIAYRRVLAGQKDIEYRLKLNIKMLTPKTPAYQKLNCTFRTYFVPNSRVWTNWEKFKAQKGGATETKIESEPNGIAYLNTQIYENSKLTYKNYFDTTLYRDSYYSVYMPRIGVGTGVDGTTYMTPKISKLPLRGATAIYNDFERNKEYDEKWTEYTGDTGDSSYSINMYAKTNIRGKRPNSYYTDYRTELLGANTTEPDGTATSALIDITEWEKTVSEYRSQAENAQLNDWDIIAKLYGSKKLTQGKVQLLSTKTVGLNYQAITQTTYNTNSEIAEEYQTLGTQGAYSYTEINLPLYQMQQFDEEGYIHVIMQVWAESVFETGYERTSLNVKWNDQYRPDLKDVKNDVLYDVEKGATVPKTTGDYSTVTGYKRKFSEYFKLPNAISGDMTTYPYYNTYSTATDNTPQILTNKSFQFFEQNDKNYNRGQYLKNIWQDYTDIMINDNLAIKNDLIIDSNNKIVGVQGQNQIFFVGKHSIITELPIDESIKTNFTKWGEK